MPSHEPQAMPGARTTKVCMVIGTGQNGTWALADTVSKTVPDTASTASRSRLRRAAGHRAAARVGAAGNVGRSLGRLDT